VSVRRPRGPWSEFDDPRSWESARLRDTLQPTVGSPTNTCSSARTEPVRVQFWVDNILPDPDPAAGHEIDRRQDEIAEPDDTSLPAHRAWNGSATATIRSIHLGQRSRHGRGRRRIPGQNTTAHTSANKQNNTHSITLQHYGKRTTTFAALSYKATPTHSSAAITTRAGHLNLNVSIHVTDTPAPNDADLQHGTTALPGTPLQRAEIFRMQT
jgi:hypothetical protein